MTRAKEKELWRHDLDVDVAGDDQPLRVHPAGIADTR